MVFKNLSLILISSFSFLFCFSQSEISLSGKKIYNSNGVLVDDSKLADEELIIYVSEGFCIGCVDYLVASNISNYVLFAKVDFSILNIASYPQFKDWSIFFSDKNDLAIEEKKGLAVLIKNKNSSTFSVLDYEHLVKITNNFTKKKKTFRKELKVILRERN